MLKNTLDKKIKENAFEDLSNQKMNHSKVMDIEHNNLELQKYFKNCNIKITLESTRNF